MYGANRKPRPSGQFLIALTTLLAVGCGRMQEAADDVSASGAATSMPKGPHYRIVERKDISIKAVTKPLSSYRPGELEKLPTNVRLTYRILVRSDLSPEQLKATMIQLVKDETARNPDIDEIAVFAYDREEDIKASYTFGKLEWCPKGDWGGVTPSIARNNDRRNYKYNIDIKAKVGDQSSRPTQREFHIFDAFQNALWADTDAPEEDVKKKVASELNITVQELERAWLKVVAYQME